MAAGDIQSRAILINKQFLGALDEMAQKATWTSQKMARTEKRAVDKSKKVSEGWSQSWWKRFGVVALGFTIAYRAMNAFEAGLRKLGTTMIDSIKESGELASIQAKLAFWYQMHSKEVIGFADAYQMAAVNVDELMKVSVKSISSLEELATGMDEVAQAVGSVPAALVPALASVVDFTVMVAQTTGSTTRQIRQELQAFMEGQMRTTNILIRALKNVGIITKADIANLKAMTNRAEIFEKVLTTIHERWEQVRDTIIAADVNRAMAFWEKSIRYTMVQSTKLASELEGVSNIFAVELAESARRYLTEMSKLDWQRNIVLMQRLRDILVLAIRAFEATVKGVSYLAVGITNLSSSFTDLSHKGSFLVKALGGLLIASTISKAFKALGKTMIWLVKVPFMLLYRNIFLIPALIGLAAIAVETLSQKFSIVGEAIRDIVGSIRIAYRDVEQIILKIKNIFKKEEDRPWYFRAPIIDPKAIKDSESFWKLYKKNFSKHISDIANFIRPFAKEMADALEKLLIPKVDEAAAKETGEGLGWAFGKGAVEGFEDATKKIAEKWRKDKTKIYEGMTKDVKKLLYSEFEYEKWLLDLRKQYAMDKALGDIEVIRMINLWHTAALTDLIKEHKKTYDILEDMSERTANAMEQAFGDLFFDMIMGKLETLRDYINAFNRALARSTADILSGALISGVTAGVSAYFKGPVVSGKGTYTSGTQVSTPYTGEHAQTTFPHAGANFIGVSPVPMKLMPVDLFKNAPRLHAGTEYPAILEYGEKVIPRGQTSLEGGTDINVYLTVVAADARSVSDMMHRNPQAIVGPLKNALISGDKSLINLLRRTK